MREARVAYLTTGHGELNEAGEGKVDGRTSKLMKGLLEGQNYIVKDLGLTQGLANDVPNDAALVVVLGPTRAFSREETAAVSRYTDKGGHLLLALDPDGGADLAPLAAAVGLTWGGVTLANERLFVPRRHNPSDHAFIGSNRYSSHASVSTLSRYGSSKAVVFDKATSIDKKDGEPGEGRLRREVAARHVRRRERELHRRSRREEDDVQPGRRRDEARLGRGAERQGRSRDARVFVTGDADCFSDAVLAGNEANQIFTYDAVRWLGGEESYAGAIASNDDVRIEHTKQKDVLWFYGTIFGAPGLVLALGLWRTRCARAASRRSAARRRRQEAPRRRAEAERQAEAEDRRRQDRGVGIVSDEASRPVAVKRARPKDNGVLVHAAVLVIAAGAATFLWTREKEGGKPLVAGDVTVWPGRSEDVRHITYESKTRKVDLDMKQDSAGRYLEGTVEKDNGPAKPAPRTRARPRSRRRRRPR